MSHSHSHGHRSTMSPHSRSDSHLMNYSEEITDAELIKQVNDIKQQIRILSLENEIFERVIMRLEPTLMHGIQQALDYATKLQSNSSLNVGSFVKSQTSKFGLESLMSPSRMLTSPSKDRQLYKAGDIISAQRQVRSLFPHSHNAMQCIMRLEPTLMHGIQQALDYATKLQSNSSLNVGSFVKSQTSKFGLESLMSPSRMLTSPSKVSTRRIESSARVSGTVIFGTGPRINVLERSELVSTEMEILINNLEKQRRKAATQHAFLKAQLEEIGVRETDIEKASEMFKQEVIVDGWDKIAQRIPAEIWIRFMTEWVKISDSHIGKFRLRTSTLNSQYSKLKGQIKVKAELSESLRAVDFDKLKIENNECLEIIDYKLQQLSELKKMTGDANLNLTVHKKAMMEQNGYLSNILQSIKEKHKQAVELAKEKDIIKVQAESLSQRLDDVRRVRLAYEVPDIMEYVSVKAEVADLKNSVKLLENRVHIQQIALASLNKKLKSILTIENI